MDWPEADIGVTRWGGAYFGDLITRLSPALFLSKQKKVQRKKRKRIKSKEVEG